MFKSYQASTTFLDLLWNMLLAFICCFVIAFSLMAQQKVKDTKNVDLKADYMITMVWDAKSEDDVDLWVDYESRDLVYFGHKEAGLLHLERDDLGQVNDTYYLPNGTPVLYNENREFVLIRHALTGEYVVNCHMYRKKDVTETPVTITVERLSPYKTVFKKTIVLSKAGQQETFVRLILKDANLVSLNEIPKDMIKIHNLNQVNTYGAQGP